MISADVNKVADAHAKVHLYNLNGRMDIIHQIAYTQILKKAKTRKKERRRGHPPSQPQPGNRKEPTVLSGSIQRANPPKPPNYVCHVLPPATTSTVISCTHHDAYEVTDRNDITVSYENSLLRLQPMNKIQGQRSEGEHDLPSSDEGGVT